MLLYTEETAVLHIQTMAVLLEKEDEEDRGLDDQQEIIMEGGDEEIHDLEECERKNGLKMSLQKDF